ncbi:hypothetical protein A616_04095 [Brevibacillus brevis X23]|nr:hypothetical protein A616_04095 [Brevibacillus brevis X23]
MKGADELHRDERKAIRQFVESLLEKYRLCKYLTQEDGYTFVADLDIEALEKHRTFCRKIEQAVSQLPDRETIFDQRKVSRCQYRLYNRLSSVSRSFRSTDQRGHLYQDQVESYVQFVSPARTYRVPIKL